MDWVTDVKFWALIISIIALAKSFYPEARNAWKGAKLTIETQDAVLLTHKWGYTNLHWALTFINSGGTTLRIKHINIVLKRDNESVTIPVRSFYRSPESGNQSLYSALTLKPGEEATHTFCFHHKLTQSEEKAMSDITAVARREISAPMEGYGPVPAILPRPTLSEETLSKIDSIFQKNFSLTYGEYELYIQALDGNKKMLANRQCRFTIFESDESNLRDITKSYRNGVGVTTPPDPQSWLYTIITDD